MGDPEELLESEPEVTVIYETRREEILQSTMSGGMSLGSAGSEPAASSDGGGGMSSSAGGAPFSAAGSAPTSSDSSEPAPPADMSDVIGVVQPPSVETLVETVLSIADVAASAAGKMVGPTILVPPQMLSPDGRSSDDGT